MKLSSIIKVCAFVSFIYIMLGDVFLPQPYCDRSKQIRNNINEYIIGFFPAQKLDNFENTFSELETLEKNTSGSANSPQ